MTIFTDDPELDALLRACDPVDALGVRRAAASTAASTLRFAITSRAVAKPARRRYLRPAVLAAAVVAAAVPLGLTLANPSHPTGGSKYGAELVSFATNSPRLLVGADGWRVTRADEQDARTGEMAFSSGTRSLDLHWVSGAHEKDSDKLDMTPLGHARIEGARAWVGTYDGHDFEAIWSVGGQALDARGVFSTEADFLAVASTLHRVDVNTWLDALPASVVNPDGRAATVEQMLADIPVPSGFDVGKLTESAQVSDRYQLGAKVTGAVSCAWVQQWVHGTAAQRAQASQAMATSRQWAILKEMDPAGDYPEVVWQVADAMNGKDAITTRGISFQEWVSSALGC